MGEVGGVVVTVEVRGLAEAQATIRALPAASKAAGEKFARKAGVVVERFWKLHLSGPASGTRLGVRTGTLRSSIHHEEVSPGVVVVGTDKPYARIHEFGGQTRPHVIRPRTAKMLAWRGPEGMVFARVVNHPGSKIPARPHRGPAVEAARPALDALARGAADEAVQAASRAAAQVSQAQKDELARIVAAGGTGRRT